MAITSEYCANVERPCFFSLRNWYRLVRYFINTIVARNSKKALYLNGCLVFGVTNS